MPTYAAETTVPVEKSRMELERTLHGAPIAARRFDQHFHGVFALVTKGYALIVTACMYFVVYRTHPR